MGSGDMLDFGMNWMYKIPLFSHIEKLRKVQGIVDLPSVSYNAGEW